MINNRQKCLGSQRNACFDTKLNVALNVTIIFLFENISLLSSSAYSIIGDLNYFFSFLGLLSVYDLYQPTVNQSHHSHGQKATELVAE